MREEVVDSLLELKRVIGLQGQQLKRQETNKTDFWSCISYALFSVHSKKLQVKTEVLDYISKCIFNVTLVDLENAKELNTKFLKKNQYFKSLFNNNLRNVDTAAAFKLFKNFINKHKESDIVTYEDAFFDMISDFYNVKLKYIVIIPNLKRVHEEKIFLPQIKESSIETYILKSNMKYFSLISQNNNDNTNVIDEIITKNKKVDIFAKYKLKSYCMEEKREHEICTFNVPQKPNMQVHYLYVYGETVRKTSMYSIEPIASVYDDNVKKIYPKYKSIFIFSQTNDNELKNIGVSKENEINIHFFLSKNVQYIYVVMAFNEKEAYTLVCQEKK